MRTIAPPVITAPANICPNGNGTASVAPPAEGGQWQYVSWQITNGYFTTNYYPYQSTYASDPTVQFYADGSGQPVQLTVFGQDDGSHAHDRAARDHGASEHLPER